jgi:GAF domain-containing protein
VGVIMSSNVSAADAELVLSRKVQELERELDEAHRREVATAEVLRLINRSPKELQPVFESLARHAAELCGSLFANVIRFDGELQHFAARSVSIPELLPVVGKRFPMRPDASTVSGRVILNRDVVCIEDIFQDPQYDTQFAIPGGSRRMLGVPMLLDDRPVGAIVVGWADPGPIPKVQEKLLRTFATQAAIAIENTRLFEAEQARTSELTEALEQQTATADVLKVISRSALDLQRVLDALVESAARLCNAYDAAIFQVFGDGLRLVAHHGELPKSGPVGQLTRPLVRGFIGGRAVIDRRTIQVADILTEADEYPESHKSALQLRYRTALCVPLVHAGKAIGVILIRRAEVRPFTDKQIELIETFADQAVIAIENARLFEEVQEKNYALTEAHAQVNGAFERETATSEILRVIGSSPTDVQPVFETIARSGVNVCGALGCVVLVVDGDMIRVAATHGVRPERLERFHRDYPIPLSTEIDTAQTIRQRCMFHLADIENNTNATAADIENARLAGYRTRLMVPMVRGDRTLGLIAVTREDPTPFPDQLVELLKTFADQAVIAIENTRLFEAEQSSKRELQESLAYQTAISEVLSVISRSPSQIGPVMETIASTARKLCQAERAIVWRIEGDAFRAVAFSGMDVDRIEQVLEYRLPLGSDSTLGRAAQAGHAVQILDTLSEPGLSPVNIALSRSGNIRTIFAVPLLRDGNAIGGITLSRTVVAPFTDPQIALVETFADQAVIAIENARLFEEVQARTRELAESLEYQTATSEVLRVISRSQADLKPVYETMLAKAMLHCEAHIGVLHRYDGREFHSVAESGIPPAYERHIRTTPQVAGPDTALGQMLATKQPVHVHDVRDSDAYRKGDPMRRATVDLGGARTLLTVPLIKDGEVIGDFAFYRKEVRLFSDKQIELVKNFASQAVIAIENTRLFEEVQARTAELTKTLERQTATSEVLSVISRSPTQLQPVLDAIAATAARLCRTDFTYIVRLEGDRFRLVATNNADAEHARFVARNPQRLDRGSLAGRVALERRTIHVRDVLEDPEYTRWDSQRLGGQRSMLGVPLLREGETIGVMLLLRTAVEPFTEYEIEIVTTFADQAVIAIENTRLFEEVQTRTRELQESLKYQTATGEVLGVISRSPTELQPVLDSIAATAARLCESVDAQVYRVRDGKLAMVAQHGTLQRPGATFPGLPLTRGSVTGRAVLDQQTIHVDDLAALVDSEYPDAKASQTAVGHRTTLATPLLRRGESLGAILLRRIEVRPFSERQRVLLQTFADQAVIAIENARLFEEVQARNRDLTALGEVGRAVSSTLDLKTVLKTIVERAVELSGTDAGSIFYYHLQVARFELGETSGLDDEVVARFRKLDIAAGQTGLGEAIAKRQPLQVPDVSKRPSNALRDAALEANLHAALIVPLLGSEGPLGALVLQRRRTGEFSPSVVNLMQSFTDQSCIALENARLFNEIAQKSRELEIASQHKSQFVANMSHELRTPLAAMLGYAELLRDGMFGELPEKSIRIIERVQANGKHLLGLINTVLDISKIESGQFQLGLVEYSLDSMVETVRVATESLASAKKLSFRTDVVKGLPYGLGDEPRLTQVLLNLVGNAIKFTDAGEVCISAGAKNGSFVVSVSDTGPGIPDAERERIFDKFHQVDSTSTKTKGGTGLGLAIAKEIVEMHGGRIWVESIVGQGAIFYMELPVRARASGAAA